MTSPPAPEKTPQPRPVAVVPRGPWRARTAVALSPGALAGALFIFLSSWESGGRRHFTLFDDAMISMTYARTLARTGELVWFEGAPRVEGFTNPLWTLIMAGLHALGLQPSHIALGIMLVGWASVLATGAMGAWLCLRLRPEARWAPPLVAFTIAMTYPLVFWSLRGLEVGLITAVTTAALVAAIAWSDSSTQAPGRRFRLTLVVAFLTLGLAIRLDFAVIAVVVAAWMVWQSPAGAHRLRTTLLLAGALVGTMLLLTWARFAYYGELVPNTYWLKIAGVSHWARLERGLVTSVKLLPTLALAATGSLFLWRQADPRRRGWLALVLASGLSVVAYSVWVGGDAWEYVPNRYVAPFLVCAAVVGIAGVERRCGDRPGGWPGLAWVVSLLAFFALGLASVEAGWRWRLGVLGAAAGLGSLTLWLRHRSGGRLSPPVAAGLMAAAMLSSTSGIGYLSWALVGGQYVDADRRMAEEGWALRRMTAPQAVLAVVWAGAPVYYSERPAVDLLGKSDRHVAALPSRVRFRPGHDRWDYQHSIHGHRPDVIHQLWEATSEDWRAIIGAGYEAYCFEPRQGERKRILVRSDSDLVDRKALERC